MKVSFRNNYSNQNNNNDWQKDNIDNDDNNSSNNNIGLTITTLSTREVDSAKAIEKRFCKSYLLKK